MIFVVEGSDKQNHNCMDRSVSQRQKLPSTFQDGIDLRWWWPHAILSCTWWCGGSSITCYIHSCWNHATCSHSTGKSLKQFLMNWSLLMLSFPEKTNKQTKPQEQLCKLLSWRENWWWWNAFFFFFGFFFLNTLTAGSHWLKDVRFFIHLADWKGICGWDWLSHRLLWKHYKGKLEFTWNH